MSASAVKRMWSSWAVGSYALWSGALLTVVRGLNPASRASWSRSPVRAIARSKTLTTWVPSDPAKTRSPPTALSPATRPCLWAVVPSGRYLAEGLGHLEPDVAGADDQRRFRVAVAQSAVEVECLGHVMQQVHAGQVDARERRHDRVGAGADDEPVVGDDLGPPRGGSRGQPLGVGVERDGDGAEPKVQPARLEVGDGAVGEVVPVAYLAAEPVGQAADREVGVLVGDQDGHVGVGGHCTRAQAGLDARVAASHDHHPAVVGQRDQLRLCCGCQRLQRLPVRPFRAGRSPRRRGSRTRGGARGSSRG